MTYDRTVINRIVFFIERVVGEMRVEIRMVWEVVGLGAHSAVALVEHVDL